MLLYCGISGGWSKSASSVRPGQLRSSEGRLGAKSDVTWFRSAGAAQRSTTHSTSVRIYIFFLSLRHFRLTKGILFLTGPSVRPSVRLLVHSFVHRYCETRYFENEWTDFVENWQKWSTGQGDETVSFWGQEIKDQDHTIPKLDLEVWRRHRSGPLVQ